MAALSIRDLDDEVRERLRRRASYNGRSMEAEVRSILSDAVSEAGESKGFLDALLDVSDGQGGVEIDIPDRSTRPRAAEFGS